MNVIQVYTHAILENGIVSQVAQKVARDTYPSFVATFNNEGLYPGGVGIGIEEDTRGHFSISPSSATFLVVALQRLWHTVMNHESTHKGDKWQEWQSDTTYLTSGLSIPMPNAIVAQMTRYC